MGSGDVEFSISPAGHFRLSLEFLEKGEIHPPSGGMENVWFDREDERKFEISAEELVEEWRGERSELRGSLISFPEKK